MKSVLAAHRLVPVLVIDSCIETGNGDEKARARGLAEVVEALQMGGNGGPPDEGSGGIGRFVAWTAAQAALDYFKPLWKAAESSAALEQQIAAWFRKHYGRR